MPVVKVKDKGLEQALAEFKKLSTDIKRTAIKYVYYLRPALKKKEKKKRADIKRKYY